jgi:hypothetical protein
MLSGKSENELVPKFRVIFAPKLYFLQFQQRETSPRNQPARAHTRILVDVGLSLFLINPCSSSLQARASSVRMCKRLERRIRATPSAPHPSYAYKLVSAPVRFARNSLPHPPTRTHTRFVQKRTRNAKPISMSCMDSRFRGRKCQLALPFPPAEAKLLVTGHRPRHDIAAGIGALPDAAVSNIFRRNAGSFRSSRMKSALSARKCRNKSRLVSRIFTRQFPFLTACDSRLGVVQSCGLRYPKT